jgi:hypothetical protein
MGNPPLPLSVSLGSLWSFFLCIVSIEEYFITIRGTPDRFSSTQVGTFGHTLPPSDGGCGRVAVTEMQTALVYGVERDS